MEIRIENLMQELPEFDTHDEAKAWFEEKYQDRFVLGSTDIMEGTKVYYYHLVKEPNEYRDYMANVSNGSDEGIESMQPFYSYSTIEIAENGGISISL
ncbi:hypothetical protein [Peribacillus glennii]|uniref:Uncharacterized protein n=1 Tax=Peribacillus glennii TaxID=2303991 RepID=A0A372LG22_9BACI|nr:hypothetical protein [Peribacillus glennii]RFU64954.1 hypothetical protein D0466_03300 [Peribacillus glennii]